MKSPFKILRLFRIVYAWHHNGTLQVEPNNVLSWPSLSFYLVVKCNAFCPRRKTYWEHRQSASRDLVVEQSQCPMLLSSRPVFCQNKYIIELRRIYDATPHSPSVVYVLWVRLPQCEALCEVRSVSWGDLESQGHDVTKARNMPSTTFAALGG